MKAACRYFMSLFRSCLPNFFT